MHIIALKEREKNYIRSDTLLPITFCILIRLSFLVFWEFDVSY